MTDIKTEIIQLLKDWKVDLNKEIDSGRLFLFGSLINFDGKQFNSNKSDIDLIIEFPKDLTNAIAIRNWLLILKKKKEILEQKLTFLMKKDSNSEEIVSLLPVTQIELSYNLHKSNVRNFFEINEFYEVETDLSEKGSVLFPPQKLESELMIQAIESTQKVRNDFLKNSAIYDFKKLDWAEEDRAIPKELARHCAKIKASISGEIFNADALNLSLGVDFLKSLLSDKRDNSEIYELYCWVDSRTNGSSIVADSKLLAQENHLLFYEIVFEKILEILPTIMKKETSQLTIEFSELNKTFISDTSVLDKLHSHKNTLLLEDIFIGPNLSYFDDTKNDKKEIKYNTLIDEFLSNKKIVISGTSQSGKTTICKKLIAELFALEFIPIFIFDDKEKLLGNIETKITNAFNSQYESNTPFENIDKNQFVIIIDDFHKAKNKAKVLNSIEQYSHQILIIDDIFGLRYKEENLISDFNTFNICELTPSQRYELIENWVLLSDTTWKNENEIIKEIEFNNDLVDTSLGKIIGQGILPSYPFFILSLIIGYESGKPLDNITSQGHFYQSLIVLYLQKVGVNDFDPYLNFLIELSFEIYNSKYNQLSQDEFDKFVLVYKENYNLTVPLKELLQNLRKTNIISLSDLGDYKFSYPYLYYFFVAKYFSENTEENKSTIINIIDNLHINENAYISIFITHHDKNNFIVEKILESAKKLFNIFEPSTLCKNELDFFDEESDEIIEASLTLGLKDYDNNRKKDLAKKDEEEKEKNNSINESDDADLDDELGRELRRSFKTVEVIGRIIKNRADSLKKTQIEELFEEGMLVHLRLLSSFVQLIKKEEAQQELIEIIASRLQIAVENKSEKNQERLIQDEEKLKKIAKHIFWNINYSFIYSINSKIIHSLGSSKLSNNVKVVCDKINSPASLLVKHGIFMRYDKSLQIDKIYDEKEELNFSTTADKVLIQKIVNHCQTHSFKDAELIKIQERMNVSKKYLTKRK